MSHAFALVRLDQTTNNNTIYLLSFSSYLLFLGKHVGEALWPTIWTKQFGQASRVLAERLSRTSRQSISAKHLGQTFRRTIPAKRLGYAKVAEYITYAYC